MKNRGSWGSSRTSTHWLVQRSKGSLMPDRAKQKWNPLWAPPHSPFTNLLSMTLPFDLLSCATPATFMHGDLQPNKHVSVLISLLAYIAWWHWEVKPLSSRCPAVVPEEKARLFAKERKALEIVPFKWIIRAISVMRADQSWATTKKKRGMAEEVENQEGRSAGRQGKVEKMKKGTGWRGIKGKKCW